MYVDPEVYYLGRENGTNRLGGVVPVYSYTTEQPPELKTAYARVAALREQARKAGIYAETGEPLAVVEARNAKATAENVKAAEAARLAHQVEAQSYPSGILR